MELGGQGNPELSFQENPPPRDLRFSSAWPILLYFGINRSLTALRNIMGILVHCGSFEVALRAGPDLANVTPHLSRLVEASAIRDGVANLTAIGSTASLTTIEYEPGAVEDLKRAIEALAPPGAAYAHEMAWHDGNGHSHVQAALLGPSLVVPIRDRSPRLGTWQQVVLINHDIHARRRRVEVTLVGNP